MNPKDIKNKLKEHFSRIKEYERKRKSSNLNKFKNGRES